MTKKSPGVFREFCDHLTRDPRLKSACQKIGLSETQLYRWLARSQQGDLEFAFHFLDDKNPTPLHVAIRQAQTIYHQSLVSEAEHVGMYGRWVPAHYKGQPTYQRDPTLDGYTDEELRAEGRDRYKRDPETGELMPVMIWEPPATQLMLAVLTARAPKVYGTKIQHTVDQRVNLGVTVVQPPKITPPPVTVVETPALPPPEVTEAEFTEEPDPSFLDGEYSEPEPPEVSYEATPLRRELEQLAAARLATASKVTPPPTITPTAADRIGDGRQGWRNGKPPGGYKLS
jgi:hypothetical protein